MEVAILEYMDMKWLHNIYRKVAISIIVFTEEKW